MSLQSAGRTVRTFNSNLDTVRTAARLGLLAEFKPLMSTYMAGPSRTFLVIFTLKSNPEILYHTRLVSTQGALQKVRTIQEIFESKRRKFVVH